MDPLQKIKDDIATIGWSVVAVFAGEDGPTFNYTVGLYETFGHPEVIMFGVPPESAHGLCHNLVNNFISKDVTIEVDEPYNTLAEGFLTRFITVDDSAGAQDKYLCLVERYYEDRANSVPAIQLVWPDPNNVFPWESGFNERYRSSQPLLGEPPAALLAPKH